jgi:hypothetical protein
MSGAAADIRRAEPLRHNSSPNGTHNCLPLHQPFKSGHSTSGVGSAGGGSAGAVDYQPPIQCGEIISVAAAARKLRSTPTLSEISFEDLPPGGTRSAAALSRGPAMTMTSTALTTVAPLQPGADACAAEFAEEQDFGAISTPRQ